MGRTFSFTDQSTNATQWSWNFGDGNTSTQQNPSNTYSIPGPFWVTLTVTDASGLCTATSTQQINIAPNCCATLITYNYNGPTVIDNSTGNYSFSQNYTVNQTINVTAPFILTVPSGITIEFGPQGKIIVENNPATGNGARLIMQPGSKLTSITNSTAPSCPVMWQGVEVWGNSDNASLNSLGQGKVTMNPGATIENAHIGVLLGKKSTCIPGPNVRCAFFDIGNSGGIIDANGAVFNKNAISIRFFPYQKINTSKIQACTFNGGVQVLDSGYVDGNSYTYPTSADPYYAPSNQLGVSFWHVYLWGVKDVKFFDNTFNTVWSEAILAIDSRFNVKKLSSPNGNIFSKLHPGIPYFFGIRIINTVSSPSYYHEISDNRFIPCPFIGIGIDGNQGLDLIQRNFFVAPQINPLISNGIYLTNSSGFNINDNNQFNTLGHSIQVQNSGIGGGNIGFPGGNTFTNCSYNSAITAWGFGSPPPGNPYLQIKCNNFNNSLSQYYQANPSHNPILSNNIITDNAIPSQQGSYPANQSEDKKPAGNEFFPEAFNRNQIYSYTPYIYYRHHLDAQGGLKILPDPNSLITLSENPNVNKTLTSCDPDPCSICSPNCCRLAQLIAQATQLQTLKQEYNTLLFNLDKGQTAQLIAAINHNKVTPPGQLKDMLIAASPLSNEVLFAFINRTVAQTPPGIFKDVLTPNLPVSDTALINALLPKLNTLPPGIANQIRTLQGNNPAYRTLTSIMRDINSIETQRAQALSGVIGYYVENDSLDKLTALLENEGTDYSNQLLFAMYLADSNLTTASAKLSILPNSTPAQQSYINLNTMLISLASEGETVFEMDSAQEQLVRQIATMSISCLARTNARAILLLVFNERFSEEMPSNSIKILNNEDNNADETDTERENSIYPNPASENIEFHYRLSDGEKGLLEIFSVIGNKIVSYPFFSTQEQLNIPVKSFENGIYLYRFSVNGELVEEGKLVIINK